MSGSEQFWSNGTWFFLVYGFVILGIAAVRAKRMERRYIAANEGTEQER